MHMVLNVLENSLQKNAGKIQHSYKETIPITLCFLFIYSYRQAQATVLEALPLLNRHSIATKRPEDYFAEMAKSDQHMQKVSLVSYMMMLFFFSPYMFHNT